MANSSLTYVIDNLLDKKLISKRINSKDKRAFVIDLTNSGKDLISKLFVRHEQTIEELFNVLSKDEISAIATNLKKLGLKAQALKEK
jgi:MarR family 2-MHQ and catechol resistance regulon transcriptional repressor